MKKIFALSLLSLLIKLVIAQNTYTKVCIPDNNFRNNLINKHNASLIANTDSILIDINKVRSIISINQGINTLAGVENFIELDSLYVVQSNLKEVDLTNLTKLRYLGLWDNELTSIDLSHNPMLIRLQLFFNKISKIDLSNNKKISFLRCHGIYELDSLILPELPDLEEIHFDVKKTDSLDFSKSLLLTKIDAGRGSLKKIKLPKTELLKHINISENELESIDVSMCPNLEFLFLINNKLSTIDVSTNLNLNRLDLRNNNLTDIKMGDNDRLKILSLCNNFLEDTLYFSQLDSLELLIINDNKIQWATFPSQVTKINAQNNLISVDTIDLSHLTKINSYCFAGNNINHVCLYANSLPSCKSPIVNQPTFGECTVTTGLDKNNYEHKLYPNPFEDFFYINFINIKPTITIYDIFGNKIPFNIEEENNNFLKININSPKGIYYLKLKYRDKIEFKKIIKK